MQFFPLKNKLYIIGLSICYLLFVGNLCAFVTLLIYDLPRSYSIHFFERHHLNIFLFIITSGCILSKYKNFRFFRMIGWYAGFVILLSCILLFIESVIYSNYITAYFNISEKTSLLTTICFILIALSLLDLSLMQISRRLLLIACLLLFLSSVGILLNVMHIKIMGTMPIYSAINFILIAFCYLFLLKQPKLNLSI